MLPGVRRWWLTPDEQWPVDDPEAHPYTILLDDNVVGFIQWYEEDDPDYRHAGLDIFLDPEFHGRGLGAEALQVMCAHLLDERGHHRLVIDPETANTAAVRSYSKVGFKAVGVMREYARGEDGVWRDGLLMDLLAPELVRPAR